MAAPFTRGGIRRGFLMAQPLGPGTALYGMVFGLLATERGLSTLEAMLMSVFVFSGSAQLASLQAVAANAGILGVIFVILTLNARYMLYSAALRPWMGSLPASTVYPSLFFLGDGAWMMAMKAHEAGEDDAGIVLGSGLAAAVWWWGGTLFGHVAGGLIPDPRMLGADFLLVAFSAAMAATMVKRRGDVVPMASAALVAALVHGTMGLGWTMVLAGLAGGAAAFLTWRPSPA
jgi:predicted branched-subunit amino acid permease